MTIQNQSAKRSNNGRFFLIEQNKYFINENEQATTTKHPVLLNYMK